MYTIAELRKALKTAGYKLQIKTYSDFKAGIIKDNNGATMPSIYTQENYKHWEAARQIREFYKGKVFDDLYRVVI